MPSQKGVQEHALFIAIELTLTNAGAKQRRLYYKCKRNAQEGTKRGIVCSAYYLFGVELLCPPRILSAIMGNCGKKGLQLIFGCNAHHEKWGVPTPIHEGSKFTILFLLKV